MSFLRPLLLVAVVVFSSWLSTKYSEHHASSHGQVFQSLYRHVVPAALVQPHHVEESEGEGSAEAGEHGHSSVHDPVLAIDMPFLPKAFDGDRNRANGVQILLTNLQIFQVAAVLLVLIAFSGVPRHFRTGKGDAISRMLAGMCMAIRDEMVVPVMGDKDGGKFLPFFLAIFFFILFMNLMGLVPGSATATASIFVTAALAVVTFATMIGAGMAVQGPVHFWKNLVPHVPGWLWPLMFLVEVLGLLVKPFALMIRLFANMTGGHLVVLSFTGLIFLFAGAEHTAAAGWGIAPVSVAFAVFIMIIEAFVALLQAYIFTQLSILFIGACIHPEH